MYKETEGKLLMLNITKSDFDFSLYLRQRRRAWGSNAMIEIGSWTQAILGVANLRVTQLESNFEC